MIFENFFDRIYDAFFKTNGEQKPNLTANTEVDARDARGMIVDKPKDENLRDKLKSMTKLEIDKYAEEAYNVKLDRRRTKSRMIEDLIDAINSK